MPNMKHKIDLGFISLIAFSCSLIFQACSNGETKAKDKVAKIDTLDCWVDSSLRVLSFELNKSYENVYDFPRFNFHPRNEMEIIAGLIDNKTNLAILHRKLDSTELAIIEQKENFRPKQYEFGFDAYVFITSENSVFKTINVNDLESCLKDVNCKGKFVLCVENAKSQALNYLRTHFKLDNNINEKVFSLGTNAKMMEYLRNNPGSIGLIPFSLISDIESEKTIQFLSGLNVLNVISKDNNGKIREVEPSQSSITTGDYPLVAPMVLVNCNMDKKSGTNFVNYIFKTKAQRLIQQFGLVPAVFPGREVVIHQ